MIDDVCEACGRSIMGRFQEEAEEGECRPCRDEWALLDRAGKLREDGWSLVVVKIEAEDDVLET